MGTIVLDAGFHSFRLRYEQAGGGLALSADGSAGRAAATGFRERVFPGSISPTEYRVRRALPLVTGALLLAFWILLARQPAVHHAAERVSAWTRPLDRPRTARWPSSF